MSIELLTAIITGAVSLVGALSAAIVAVLKARQASASADRSEGHALVSESHAEKALSGAPLQ